MFEQHEEIQCANCSTIIALRKVEMDRLRENHKTFFCPRGHSNYFPEGKSPKEKRIAELEHRVEQLKERNREQWRHAMEARDEWKVCQWPGCRGHRYSDMHSLRRHMRKAHGMPTDAEFEERDGKIKPQPIRPMLEPERVS